MPKNRSYTCVATVLLGFFFGGAVYSSDAHPRDVVHELCSGWYMTVPLAAHEVRALNAGGTRLRGFAVAPTSSPRRPVELQIGRAHV